MKIISGIVFIVFALSGLAQTVLAMRAADDIDKIKWQLHSIKSLGFMILFFLMVVHQWPD